MPEKNCKDRDLLNQGSLKVSASFERNLSADDTLTRPVAPYDVALNQGSHLEHTASLYTEDTLKGSVIKDVLLVFRVLKGMRFDVIPETARDLRTASRSAVGHVVSRVVVTKERRAESPTRLRSHKRKHCRPAKVGSLLWVF